ncbi:50S ribosomal protein L13, partial [Francisella tularensis subsp. holarctica]|uniref:50S ribosomal protein L13 n=1 Tax=Francisella tularensis TaxID=263 RepID=UPI002381AD74
MDTGDYVVIVNAEKIAVTGNKRKSKTYYHHTGYIGGIKSVSFENLIATHPERAIEKAVRGMLPITPLGRTKIKKLKVYAREAHPQTAQQP